MAARPSPRSGRPAVLAALVGALAWAGAAAGQEAADEAVGPPMQLIPPADPDPPASRAPVEVRPLMPRPGPAAADPTLERPSDDPAGWWAGLAPAEVGRLIGQLPVGAGSPAMRDLARRLLTAPVPAEAATAETLAERAAHLADLALTGSLESLAERHGGFADAPAAALPLAEARLLAGDGPRACALVEAVAPADDADWWPLALHCALEAGAADRTRVLIDALGGAADRPARDPVRATLAALAEARLAGAPPDLPEDSWRVAGSADPVLIAMMDAAGLPQTRAILTARAPAVLAAVARGAANDPDLRAEAAEGAAEAGAIPPAGLAALWAGLPFAESPAETLSRSAREQGPGVRARLMRAAAQLDAGGEALEARRYRLRALALAQAESAPLGVVLGVLSTLDPAAAADDPAAGTVAARAYYAAGDAIRGDAWRTAALAAGDPTVTAAFDRLWPLERLARPAWRVDDGDRLAAWFAAELDGVGEIGAHAAATVLALLQAIGDPVDAALWRRLPVDDARESALLPAAQLAGRLSVEARPSQPAATALLALVALGDRGPGRAHPLLLGAVVQALARAGLDEDARRFAREAVWAAQL